jgi:para-nitrobenzyl esterase
MRCAFKGLLIAVSMLGLGGATHASQDAVPVVTTEAGQVAGVSANAVDAFLGIPYADDTGGQNRWQPPKPPVKWTGVRAATDFGDDCTQVPPHVPPTGSPWTDEYFPARAKSENCLFVNVWRPAGTRPTEKLAVMVWIHGGAFVGGSGSVPLYNGAALARRGIIVVSLNYRLGPFGFMAHPALTAEGGSSGNYGLMDQIAALRWVQNNITQFGGDPAQVTVAGQSAGAASVHAQLSAPSAAGLFVRAIAQSGSGMGLPTMTRDAAEAMGERLMAAAGVNSIADLRALPAEQVTKAATAPDVGPPGPRYAPIAEPAVLPDPAAQRQDIPVLTGLNNDETSTGPDWSLSSAEKLSTLLNRRFGDKAPVFAAYYRGSDGPAAMDAAQRLLREQAIAAMLIWAAQRPAGAAPVHAYLFQHAQPGSPTDRFGTFHTAEMPYVFGTLDKSNRPFQSLDRQIAATVGSYWVNFVRTGNPNGKDLPNWPDLGSGKIMGLGDKTGPMTPLDAARLQAYMAFHAGGGRLGLF